MKKLISLLAALVLTAACFSGFSVIAEESSGESASQTSVWDGTVPEADENYIFEGRGTEKSPYLIQSAAELAQLASNVRFDSVATCYKGKYFKLTVDIDMNNYKWYSIGGYTAIAYFQTEQNYFAGHFDGDGHVITNFNLATTMVNEYNETVAAHKVGLFGYVAGGSVKNIGIESGSVTFSGNKRVGALVGAARYGYKIVNCYNKANITIDANDIYSSDQQTYVGGIVGWSQDYPAQNPDAKSSFAIVKSEKLIESCYNAGNITVTDNSTNNILAGGVAGNHMHGAEIVDCWNTGNIDITYVNSEALVSAGGIVGNFASDISFEGIHSACKITYSGTLPEKYNHGILLGAVDFNSLVVSEGAEWKALEGSTVKTSWSDRLYETSGDELPATLVDTLELPVTYRSFLYDPAEVSLSASDKNDDKKDNSDETEETEADTQASSSAPSTTEATEDEGGCGSALCGGIALIGVASVAMCTFIRKKKNAD